MEVAGVLGRSRSRSHGVLDNPPTPGSALLTLETDASFTDPRGTQTGSGKSTVLTLGVWSIPGSRLWVIPGWSGGNGSGMGSLEAQKGGE